jgi:hypothetical protein
MDDSNNPTNSSGETPDSNSTPSTPNSHTSNQNSNTATQNSNTATQNSNTANQNSNTANQNSNTTIVEPGLEINQVISTDNPGSVVHTTFTSTEPEIYDPDITLNLSQVVNVYDDESTNSFLMNQIKDYASKINCSDFHGKGTIDDYSELFKAASKIANESKQIQLDVDVDGFNEFSQAAEELSKLFESFTIRLQNINIINDSVFLSSVVSALEKIWLLSENFGKFKETILATTTIQFPKTSHETAVILGNVMDEINCAMNYITNFANPSDTPPIDSQLSNEEKNIISKAIETIDNWNVVCEHGVTIAMNNNNDIQAIKDYNNSLKNSSSVLKNSITNLRAKLNGYMSI